ncbi:GIY-YIG nuclease family protein [bacterium]|nr:GIY-YIG nuclease family protein [bacterium]
MFDAGLYVFLLRLKSPATLAVGALGEHHFPAGWYLYTGSAKRNLHRRVARHWSVKPTRRWHFDHLSTAPDSEPVGAVVVPLAAGVGECELNRRVGTLVGRQYPVPGFGASDCREGCPAHLWFSAAPVSLLGLARVHATAALLMPGADFWEPDLHELGDAVDPTGRGP